MYLTPAALTALAALGFVVPAGPYTEDSLYNAINWHANQDWNDEARAVAALDIAMGGLQ